MNFHEAISTRRSVYALGKNLPLSSESLHQLIESTLLVVPSAFNSRSSRLLVIEGPNHDRLWDTTLDALRPLVPSPEAFAQTSARIASFKAAAGTILFFEDQSVVAGLQTDYPVFKDNFPSWSIQGSAMAQYALWTALAQDGIGASLQHYNPLIDPWVSTTFSLPATWKLVAQMPFGSILATPDAKDRGTIQDRIRYA